MPRIERFEIYCVGLPFRRPFAHAAAVRSSSSSLFVKCIAETGAAGFGECLPREYVTGETRDGAFSLLRDRVLPRLLGRDFSSMEEVIAFLEECDGKAPRAWVDADLPQAAAWCAVDLALLDTFGRVFEEPVRLAGGGDLPPALRYSPVVSAGRGAAHAAMLLRIRLYGIRQVKLKVGRDAGGGDLRVARWVLGSGCDIRVDANMAWSVGDALRAMRELSRFGVRSFEQPVAAGDVAGLARLVRETGLGVMADESMSDRASLERLIAERACTGVNVRISKCGGLVASYGLCRRALGAGLDLQVGCQVGESSLLSAAQLALVRAAKTVSYAEGCFGLLLLREDPCDPVLRFGYGGRPPVLTPGAGLGVSVDEDALLRRATRRAIIGKES